MIPNQLHYVHLGVNGRPWKIHHFLSVKSAYVRGGFEKIKIWVDLMPEGKWWELTKSMVEVHFVEPPTEIFGIPVKEPAHMSDIIRIEILLREGGVYVDTDIIFVKPFTPMLETNRTVLGIQGVTPIEGICNAVIAAPPDATFLRWWITGFRHTFKGGPNGTKDWSPHSVEFSYELFTKLPWEVAIKDYKTFFWPLYHLGHMEDLFVNLKEYPDAYCHHLWESSGRPWLEQTTLEKIKTEDTTFHMMVRDLVQDIK